VEQKQDLNKERADLQKQITYLFQDPSRSNASRQEIVSMLREIVKTFSERSA
jgi:ABC-type dipeptide/oligopeptide/nickel transport system ATPase subunit